MHSLIRLALLALLVVTWSACGGAPAPWQPATMRPPSAPSSSASAATTAPIADPEKDTRTLWALDELTPKDKALLSSLVGKPSFPTPEDERAAVRLLGKLVSAGGFRAGAMAAIFRNKAPAAPARARAQALALVDAAARALTATDTAVCEPLRRAFVNAIPALQRNERPALLTRITLESKEHVDCARAIVTRAGAGVSSLAALDDHIILTVIGKKDDTVDAFVGGASPGYLQSPPSFDFGGYRAFFVAVPQDPPTLLRVTRKNREVPLSWNTPWGFDVTVWTLDAPVCVNIDIATAAEEAVVVNGVVLRPEEPSSAVTSGRRRVDRDVWLQPGTTDVHEVRIVRPTSPAGREWLTIASFALKDRDLGTRRCQRLSYDAAQSTGGVAVVRASVNESCLSTGVDGGGLEIQAARALDLLRVRHQDISAWASTVTGFRELRNTLMSLGAPTDRADKIDLDTSNLLGTSAGELARRGLDKILFVHIECTRHGPTESYEHFVIARSLDLAKLFQAVANGLAQDTTLDRALSVETERVRDDRQIQSGVVAAFARLLGKPYVRFIEPNTRETFPAAIEWAMEAAPDGAWEMTAKRVGDASDEQACREGIDLSYVDSPERSGDTDGPDARKTSVGRAPPQPFRVRFRPPSDGRYLVAVRVRSRQGTAVVERCVQTSTSRVAFWGDTSVLWGAMTRINDPHPTQALGTQLSLGLRFGDGFLGYGLGIGYRFATLWRATPTSWDDPQATSQLYLPTSGEASSGLLFNEWRRHTVFGAGLLELHNDASICALAGLRAEKAAVDDCRLYRVGVLARWMITFDLGWYDAENVSEVQKEFLTGAGRIDAEVSTFLQGGITIALTQRGGLYLGAIFGVFGWSKWLGGPGRQLVDQSGLLMGGFSMGFRQWL